MADQSAALAKVIDWEELRNMLIDKSKATVIR